MNHSFIIDSDKDSFSANRGESQKIACQSPCQSSITKLYGCFMPDMGVSTLKGSRNDLNQDAKLAPSPGFPIIAVCDGISGSNQGEKASALALKPFEMATYRDCKDLKKLTFMAHDWVKESYKIFGAGRPGQTTLVAARIKRGAIVDYISIGDSRAYLIKPSGFFRRSYTCEQITIDQTHGEMKKRFAYRYPDHYQDNAMIHAIGAGDIESPEFIGDNSDEPRKVDGLIAKFVKQSTISIPPGGFMLLATDGFFKGMPDDCDQIARLVEKHCDKSAAMMAKALVDEAADERFDIGDDITVAVISAAYISGARWPFWSGAIAALVVSFIMA